MFLPSFRRLRWSRATATLVLGALGLLGLAIGCGASVSSTQPTAPVDAGQPFCPAGPQSATASSAGLPSGPCESDEGPCSYLATPCPTVANGAINGYTCTCTGGGLWDCEVVNQNGLCAPLPIDDGGGDDAFALDFDAGEDAGIADAAADAKHD